MELLDLYDVNRIPKGRTMARGEKMQKGDYRLVVHVCVFSKNGKMLIQQRIKDKDSYPDLWDITVGGSAIAGETSAQAVSRELFEELGLSIDFTCIRPHLTVNFGEGFDDIYLVERDVDLQTLTLQADEVQAVRWATREEILAMIESGEFIPYFPELISLLFPKRTHYGCIKEAL